MMRVRRRGRALVCAVLCIVCACVAVPVARTVPRAAAVGADGPSAARGADVEALLRTMTLEEKVGQLLQVDAQMVLREDPGVGIDPAKAALAFGKYKVGSVLNNLLAPHDWARFITDLHDVAKANGLRVPLVYGLDEVHGTNYVLGGTLFPQHIGAAATFNPGLAEAEGRVTAAEMRALGIPWTFAPILGVAHNPFWSRVYETYGESTLLAARMGAGVVRGYQGGETHNLRRTDVVAACAKHFLGYAPSNVNNKDRTPAIITPQDLQDVYVPPFAAAFDAGARTTMICSGEINGVPVHASRPLLHTLLREQLAFDGLVVTDWLDISHLQQTHCVAETYDDAIELYYAAGGGLAMEPVSFEFADHMIGLVQSGRIAQGTVDDAVRTVLQFKADLGLLDGYTHANRALYPDLTSPAIDAVGSRKHRDAALATARESITLLRNDAGALPLRKDMRVLVTGPSADSISRLNGGWSVLWQGVPDSYPWPFGSSVLDGMRALGGREHVRFVNTTALNAATHAAAVHAARDADAVVVVVGEAPYAEGDGDVLDLDLPAEQVALVRDLARANRRVVMVLVEGRARTFPSLLPREAGVAAMVQAYLPGSEGGQAIAEALYGELVDGTAFSPAGRLPFSMPRTQGDSGTHLHKRVIATDQTNPPAFSPAFAFGHGLSYCNVTYTAVRVTPAVVAPGDEVTVHIALRNPTARTCAESVLVFVRDDVRSITPPDRRLATFTKLPAVTPGDTRVDLVVPADAMAFHNAEMQRVIEPGSFTVSVGGISAQFRVAGSMRDPFAMPHVTGPNVAFV